MNVLHISGARGWGGNEQQLLFLVEELKYLGVNQYLFCYQNTPLYENIKTQNIQVFSIPYTKPTKRNYRKYLKELVEYYDFDLLHLHTSDSVTGYVITDFFTSLKTKTVFSKKGISRKVSVLSKFKYNYKNIHKILCVSNIVLEHFKDVLFPKNHFKLCVVSDGAKIRNESLADNFDLRKDFNITEETTIIGNIANHTDAKDLKTLINVLDYLVNKKNRKEIHLVQIGEFSKRTKELKNMVKNLNLEKYISFLGFKTDASNIMTQLDIYLMTSQREGGPTTVLEAFSNKIPVVSTRVGIVYEAIEDSKNGFVTDVGDYKSLASKIEILIDDDRMKNSFAELSYNIFLNSYTSKALGKNTYSVYNEILE